jgi:hypothetical protein
VGRDDDGVRGLLRWQLLHGRVERARGVPVQQLVRGRRVLRERLHGVPVGHHRLWLDAGGLVRVHMRFGLRLDLGLEHVRLHLHELKRAGQRREQRLHLPGGLLHDRRLGRVRGLRAVRDGLKPQRRPHGLRVQRLVPHVGLGLEHVPADVLRRLAS